MTLATDSDRDLDSLAEEGAARVLDECLSLASGDVIALFYDESTQQCAEVLKRVAGGSGLQLVDCFVPMADQRRLGDARTLSPSDEAAIESARAVLICVTGSKCSLSYRKSLVRAAVDENRYVGVMPGATLDVLAHAVNLDYGAVQNRCDDLAVAMLAGDSAVLRSECRDAQGRVVRSCELVMHLGAFKRSPITSTGVIPRGTWGNLPGGETFIAPLEELATGQFVLNGAFSGHVMTSDEPIVLHFDSGRLVDIEGSLPERTALAKLLDWHAIEERGDDLFLAELGVGVNSGIGALTGHALFDEKKEGTAHIAVGDNSMYGGTLHSLLHEDFITVAPSLFIDGKAVLEQGEYRVDPAAWREDAALADSLAGNMPDDGLVLKTGLHAGADKEGRLRVTREVGARRKCIYTVGTADFSRDLARLHGLLPPMPEPIRLSLLASRWQAAGGQGGLQFVRGLVAVLLKHDLATWDAIDD